MTFVYGLYSWMHSVLKRNKIFQIQWTDGWGKIISLPFWERPEKNFYRIKTPIEKWLHRRWHYREATLFVVCRMLDNGIIEMLLWIQLCLAVYVVIHYLNAD